jgi:hypothetical protein
MVHPSQSPEIQIDTMKLSNAVLFLTLGSAAAFAPGKAALRPVTSLAASTEASTETKVRRNNSAGSHVHGDEAFAVLRSKGSPFSYHYHYC